MIATLLLTLVLSITSVDDYGNTLSFRLYDDGKAVMFAGDFLQARTRAERELEWEYDHDGNIIVWRGSRRVEYLVPFAGRWYGAISGNAYHSNTDKL